ncbi:MAG: DUF4442 domain-containing protein [Xanthomonadales bacterium]|nr:DUF4442 domain-containing protein [Xanthomonadales bacterium]
MNWTPPKLKWALRIFSPYWGAGIKVEAISKDWKYARVSLSLKRLNRNAFGTHFGGSLFAMTDPFYVLLISNILGRDYYVWDKHACIDFVKPGHGKVTAEFHINDSVIEGILENTKNGDKYLPQFKVEVKDEDNEVVAQVEKIIYIRKKPKKK